MSMSLWLVGAFLYLLVGGILVAYRWRQPRSSDAFDVDDILARAEGRHASLSDRSARSIGTALGILVGVLFWPLLWRTAAPAEPPEPPAPAPRVVRPPREVR